MSRPLVSVVLTTYNSEDTIEDVLISLTRQRDIPISNIELIIVDGGSTDNTLVILRRFLEMWANIFYDARLIVHDKNYGLSRARNDGIKASRGKYVLILDHDVIMSESTLSKLVKFLESAPLQIAACSPLLVPFPSSIVDSWMVVVLKDRITRASSVANCTLLRREVFERAGLYDETLGPPFTIAEDMEYCARIMRSGYDVVVIGSERVIHANDGRAWSRAKKSGLAETSVNGSTYSPHKTRLLPRLMVIVRSLLDKRYLYAYKKYLASLPRPYKARWYLYALTLLSMIFFAVSYLIALRFGWIKCIVHYSAISALSLFVASYASVLKEYWNSDAFHISLIYSLLAVSWRILRSLVILIPRKSLQYNPSLQGRAL